MRRIRILPLLLIISLLLPFACPGAAGAGFADISEHWAGAKIERALDVGLISYGTGYFRPDAYITRAEMAEIVCAIAPLTYSQRSYADITGEESYAPALMKACQNGLLYTPSDGSINPNGLVSREETAYLVYKLFKLPKGSGALPGSADSDSIMYSEAVSALYTAGYLPDTMTSGAWFSPKSAITRAEFIDMIFRVIALFAGRERYNGGTISGNVYAASDAQLPTWLTASGTVYIGQANENPQSGHVYLTGYWNESNALAAGYSNLLSAYTTYFIAGTTGRNTNIKLAASYINGTILLPGEEFSYNNTVGVRSAERGFQYANIFVGQTKVPGLGGGVCQVSSTLFCAALFGAMTITERSPHSMKVDYSYAGYDATVSYGYVDFKFKNDLDVPVKIVMDANMQDGALTATIYAPEGYIKPEVTVNVSQSGGAYTTTRYVGGVKDYVTYSRY